MTNSFSIFVARRLSTSSDCAHRSPGIIIGTVGVALAFIVMLVSLSTVIGFKREIKAKVMGFEAPLILTSSGFGYESSSQGMITASEALSSCISETFPGSAVAGVVDLQMLLKTDSAFTALNLRSAPADYDWRFIKDNIISGKLSTNRPAEGEIVISKTVANDLGLEVGNRVSAHFIDRSGLKSRRYTIAAIYDTHFIDYDRNMAYADISAARDLLGNEVPDSLFTSLLVYGIGEKDLEFAAPKLTETILGRIAAGQQIAVPSVETVRQRGALYFNWLDLLDTNVIVIIILMSAVSGFTLISCLFILILERIGFIGLLKAMGCRDRSIRYIFILLTEKILLKGLLLGNFIGIMLVLVQHLFHIIPLDPESYYLSYVPTALDIPVWILLNIAVIALAFFILVIPSMIISRMNSTDTMRYNNKTTY